jgi:hypothetical protein
LITKPFTIPVIATALLALGGCAGLTESEQRAVTGGATGGAAGALGGYLYDQCER